MRAYSPTGVPILGGLDSIQGRPEIAEDSWSRSDGAINYDHSGETEMFWDTATPVRRGGPKDAADDMLAALREWKCPGCGGKGTYQQNAVGREREEARGRVPDPAFNPDPVPCKVCGGHGLHPIARAAIEKAEVPERDVYLDENGDEWTEDEIVLKDAADADAEEAAA